MDIKSKNNKNKSLFYKFISNLALILLPILFFLTFKFTLYIYHSYQRIDSISLDISKLQNNLENVANDTDKLYVTYDLWLKNFVKDSSINIYDTFNDLKDLSSKSQNELNELNENFSLNSKDFIYNNVVKYIIIDKSSKKFISNSYDDINEITKNIEKYILQDGSLFNFIYKKSKWYHITYASMDSPSNKYLGRLISNSDNYIEAYWFPQNFNFSEEPEEIKEKITDRASDNLNEVLNGVRLNLSSEQNKFRSYIILIVICILLIISYIILLFKIGFRNFLYVIKNNMIISKFKLIKIFFDSRSTLFKFICFFISIVLNSILISFSLSSGNLRLILPLVFSSLILVLTLIKFFMFCKNLDNIINGTIEITNGNIDYVIKEKGDMKLLCLAENINKINKGFKVSIEEQIKNEKLKSELVANVSHDLKTPLTSIINYTDILLKKDITKEKQKDYIDILNKKSLKLKHLIEDLFEISKINSGKVELNKTKVDIVELINQSIAEYSDTEIYSSKNLSFIFKSFDPIIELELDGNRMSRVFENLINNALKYSLKDSRVFVDIDSIKHGITISFKNTSLIPLDFDKEEIFERFSRGDKSRNSNIEGSGLGLAIAKSIVELHNGKMYVDFDGDLFKIIIELHR